MLLFFGLSMPNVGSWNGRWSGESNLYGIIRNYRDSKAGKGKAQSILDTGYYHYNFGDGWAAGVSVKQVTLQEANKIRRKSKGFAGYDWMVDSIEQYGVIKPPSQR